MTTRHSRPAKGIQLRKADDLKLIKGIGPVIESRLHKAGVGTFVQLAALSAQRIAQIARLSAESVNRAQWIKQAKYLASAQAAGQRPHLKVARPAQGRRRTAPPVIRLHYATFTLELLLDKANHVRRTRCIHIQDGDQATWAGWEEAELVSFVAKHGRLHLPPPPAPVCPTPPEPMALTGRAAQPARPTGPQASPVPIPACAAMTAGETHGAGQEILSRQAEAVEGIRGGVAGYAADTEKRARGARPAQLEGPEGGARREPGERLHLYELTVMTTDNDQPHQALPAGALFRVRFSLDLTGLQAPPAVPIDCMTRIYAKHLGGGARQVIGDRHDTLQRSDKVTVEASGLALPTGLYRLEVMVCLNALTQKQTTPQGFTAVLEGGLLQIY